MDEVKQAKYTRSHAQSRAYRIGSILVDANEVGVDGRREGQRGFINGR